MTSTALITGASSGLGAEFATQLAARGHDVVLVARSRERLETEARRIRSEHGVNAEVIVQDLTEPDAAQRIKSELDARGRRVDLLVNNAGFVEAIGNEKAASFGSLLPADRVVRTALRALDRNRAYVTPGFGNAVSAHLMPRRPRALVAAIGERVTRSVLGGAPKARAAAAAR